MKPSLRFLTLVVLGWAGLRAATLGILPGAEVFRVDTSEAKSPPPIVPTEFPPIDPPPLAADPSLAGVQPAAVPISPLGGAPAARSLGRSMPVPAVATYALEPLPAHLPGQPARLARADLADRPAYFSPLPTLDSWTLVPTAASLPQRRSSVIGAGRSLPADPAVRPALDRVQLTAWAMLRGRSVGGSPSGIATGGTLGGSQAGARLTYNIDRRFAATLRSSSDVGRRGGELAAGLRVQPVPGIPVWLNAERRMRLGRYGGGRNAFALFLEGGVYDRPLGWGFSLDSYLQAGIVGAHRRDKFIDGALTVTRPLWRNLYAGVGLWGGAQPGVSRLDAGPRLTYRVRGNIKMHLDYRRKLAGNAQPGSGPVVTLAADF